MISAAYSINVKYYKGFPVFGLRGFKQSGGHSALKKVNSALL